MKHHRFIILASILSSCLTAGCGYSAEQIQIESPSDMLHQGTHGGVAVGARPLLDPDEAERVFGHPVVYESRTATTTTRGYLPVLVTFTNDTSEGLVVDKEHTRLISSDGKRAKPRGWERMYRTFQTSPVSAFVAFGIIGAAVQEDTNDDMAADWRDKELPDRAALFPNTEGVGGFLYFKDKGGLAPYLLRVALQRPSTGERLFVNVVIDAEQS